MLNAVKAHKKTVNLCPKVWLRPIINAFLLFQLFPVISVLWCRQDSCKLFGTIMAKLLRIASAWNECNIALWSRCSAVSKETVTRRNRHLAENEHLTLSFAHSHTSLCDSVCEKLTILAVRKQLWWLKGDRELVRVTQMSYSPFCHFKKKKKKRFG